MNGNSERRLVWALFLLLGASAAARAESGFCKKQAIFPPDGRHNFGSCIVQTKDGSLLAAWAAGSGELEADVVIEGAWLPRGETKWQEKFILVDTPGQPDSNPALLAAPDGTLWVFWSTTTPLDRRWLSATVKFAQCEQPGGPQAPLKWTRTGVLQVVPTGFNDEMKQAIERVSADDRKRFSVYLEVQEKRSRDEQTQRLGWTPRVHPLVLPEGRWVLPLSCETFASSIMATSDDRGATWTTSRPIIGFGNVQPSLVRKNDGTLLAMMRENGPHHRIRLSTSSDQGTSWSALMDSDLPNGGSGIEVIRLSNGHWVLIYNDVPRGTHSLAVTVSVDEGMTWKKGRHLAQARFMAGDFQYPSLLQAADGSIHATYSSGGGRQGTIEHAHFDEAWLLADDQK